VTETAEATTEETTEQAPAVDETPISEEPREQRRGSRERRPEVQRGSRDTGDKSQFLGACGHHQPRIQSGEGWSTLCVYGPRRCG